jgi:hypothetical protein
MDRRRRRAIVTACIVGVAALALGEVMVAHACPMCREAVTQTAADGGDAAGPDGRGLGSAFAWSIYVMIGVPYLMVSIAVYTVWRAVKRAQAAASDSTQTVAREAA